MDKTTTLKPCPFCGGAASMNHRHGAKVSFRATCMKCLGLAGQTHDTEAEAITAWNHRPTEQALLDALKSVAAEFENSDSIMPWSLCMATVRQAIAKAQAS